MGEILDTIPFVSVITKIELLSFNASQQYYDYLTGFLKDTIILDLDRKTVDECIQLRRRQKLKTPDAIIAATAIVNGYTLITGDAHFKNIAGLKVLNPESL